MTERRLDRVLVERGLVTTRTKAQRHIAAGVVSVNGVIETKPSREVPDNAEVTLLESDSDVGQGAKKLRFALEALSVPVKGATAVDCGASTGGFTQVLLEQGASQVVAIDVGHGQLDPSIASLPQVTNLEGVNVLGLSPQWWLEQGLPLPVDIVVADLSFVSLTKFLEPAVATFGVHSHYVLLVKPQFEVGRGHTDRGVVKNQQRREESVRRVAQNASRLGLTVRKVIASEVVGEKGNQEYFLYATATPSVYPAEWDGHVPRPREE